jgi:phage terminase large subunit-like protein
VLGGSGAGKTRTGAEWVRGLALGYPGFCDGPVGRIALVAETLDDARHVMVEGPSGLLSLKPEGARPVWSPSLRKLEWPNGAVAQIFSAEDPDSLRGPQFEAAWADEVAKWRYVEEAWDMLQFGLRLGPKPREIVTTTPRPIPLIRRLLADPLVEVSRMATVANADNLAPGFLDGVVGRYTGTRLGRQELEGQVVEDRPDALWTRDLLESLRVAAAPPLGPHRGRGRSAGLLLALGGCVRAGAAGVDSGGAGLRAADATASGLKPPEWAARAWRCSTGSRPTRSWSR